MKRIPEAPVDERFVRRWSPRAFETRPIPRETARSLFEAARWAPSCFNEQPWRFVIGIEPEDHERVLGLLAEGNRTWAHRAPLLGVVFARRRFARNEKPNHWAAFDAGAASMSLTLQANELGLATHFMGGFDRERSHEVLGVPAEDYEALAAFAVGYAGEKSVLSPELQEREEPSDRKAQAEIVFEGAFDPGRAS